MVYSSLVSQADYARQHGVSRAAVGKWKAKGYLVLQGDKVDVAASDAKLRGAKQGRFKDGEPVKRSVNPVDTDAVEVDGQLLGAAYDPDTLDAFLTNLLAGRFSDQAVADTVKANALAGQRVLELQKLAGTLIDFATAEKVLFDQARAFRDALMAWPARLAPLLAALFDIPAEKMIEALNGYVHDFLSDLGEPDEEDLREEDYDTGR